MCILGSAVYARNMKDIGDLYRDIIFVDTIGCKTFSGAKYAFQVDHSQNNKL